MSIHQLNNLKKLVHHILQAISSKPNSIRISLIPSYVQKVSRSMYNSREIPSSKCWCGNYILHGISLNFIYFVWKKSLKQDP